MQERRKHHQLEINQTLLQEHSSEYILASEMSDLVTGSQKTKSGKETNHEN